MSEAVSQANCAIAQNREKVSAALGDSYFFSFHHRDSGFEMVYVEVHTACTSLKNQLCSI